MEEFDKIFTELKEKTKKENIDQIIDLFVEYEEKNYSLYKYVRELNDEVIVNISTLNIKEWKPR